MNACRLTSFNMKMALAMASFFLLPFSVRADNVSSSEMHMIEFDKAGYTLSVRLINADISDVVAELSKVAGIKIFLDESMNRTISSSFRNVPLETGIKRVLGPEISSAFVFVRYADSSGKENYRLDTVKIFDSGKMLSANFIIFDGSTEQERGAKDIFSQPHETVRMPVTPGAIRHEIGMARKNLNMIRRKYEAETTNIKAGMARIRMELSKNISSEEREEHIRKLRYHRQNLAKIRQMSVRITTDEEKNLRELIEAEAKAGDRRKFAERQRVSEKQKRSE